MRDKCYHFWDVSFLWVKFGVSHKYHVAIWGLISRRKDFGGMVVPNRRAFNFAFLASWWWQELQSPWWIEPPKISTSLWFELFVLWGKWNYTTPHFRFACSFGLAFMRVLSVIGLSEWVIFQMSRLPGKQMMFAICLVLLPCGVFGPYVLRYLLMETYGQMAGISRKNERVASWLGNHVR